MKLIKSKKGHGRKKEEILILNEMEEKGGKTWENFIRASEITRKKRGEKVRFFFLKDNRSKIGHRYYVRVMKSYQTDRSTNQTGLPSPASPACPPTLHRIKPPSTWSHSRWFEDRSGIRKLQPPQSPHPHPHQTPWTKHLQY